MALVERSESSLAYVNKVDQVKAFMLFAFFGGDIEKTARTCAVDSKIITALAHDFRWLDQIKGQHRLDTPEGLKAEQELNRARNYVAAQRIGLILEAITLRAAEDPTKWAEMNCVEIDKETGEKTFTSKPLVEISKAAQIVQDMTYRALGDKMAGTASTTGASDGSVTNLMINVYEGLGKLKQAAKKVSGVTDAPVDIEVAAAVDKK